ncbi:MAG TPA: quinol:cytochrome C oxidoreductase, partial [Acidobacteriota bacterium]|nr:quinol:cytochrome C oxidoreductase [Acidobacteriota bacterium]
FAGCFLAGLATVTLVVAFPLRPEPVEDVVTPEHFHDLGKLLFAFVVFWAYIAFSQFMLIWYANIPEETVWYLHRLEHGWEVVTLLLVLGHFILPFFLLLSREIKRKKRHLTVVCLWLLVMHYFDLYWQVLPSAGAPGTNLLLDLATLLGLGCLFVAAFAYLSSRAAVIPVRDPRLAESLAFENM